jgi:hypothetical protein
VGLEQDPLSLVSTSEELLGRKSSSSSGLESREHGLKDPSLWPRDTLCLQKFALTSLTSGGRLVGIVCSRTQATELKRERQTERVCMQLVQSSYYWRRGYKSCLFSYGLLSVAKFRDI